MFEEVDCSIVYRGRWLVTIQASIIRKTDKQGWYSAGSQNETAGCLQGASILISQFLRHTS